MTVTTLSEYTKIASKIINKNIGSRYLTDENIGLVINYLVYADNNYDPTKGSLHNFRQCSAKIALKRIVCKRKSKTISLSHIIGKNNIEDITIEDILADTREHRNIDIEELNKLINDDCLTDLEKMYLKEHFINYKQQNHIAEDRGVTVQAVNISIMSAIKKLKEIQYVKNQ